MVKHIVLYKLKDKANADQLIVWFKSMIGKIDVLKSLTAGKNVIESDRSYDVALVCEFDSIEDLNIYAEHPVHLPVKAYVKTVVTESHSVDFEYSEEI